jgi:membrane protease YdiL (CAAX protease family)
VIATQSSAHTQLARWLSPAALVGGIAAADAVAATAGSLAGAVCHALLLLVLVNVYALAPSKLGSRACLVLALVPLAQLASLAVPTGDVSRSVREALVATLLLGALALTSGVLALERSAFALRRRELPGELLVALCGLPIGLLGQRILTPHPLAAPGDLAAMALAALVLAGLSAPALELLFRWALQAELLALYGRAAIVLVNLLFASIYVTTQSFGYVLLMGATGAGLSLAVTRTGRIWGAIGAHALLDIGVLVVWPAVLR